MSELQARALRATEQTLLVVHAESRHSGTSGDGGTGGGEPATINVITPYC